MKDAQLFIEYVKPEELTPYENNARHHEAGDLAAIRASIEQFGMNDPIGVWSKDNIVVEGHGRLIVCKEMGMKVVPIIHLDHMTDEERRAYAIAHNKTAELSDWDPELLESELARIVDIDMDLFGFGEGSDLGGELVEDKYTTKINIPQYEIQGDEPPISDMLDTEKSDELVREIQQALDSGEITEEQADFLKYAAQRHNVFNYRNIAEYYAHQGEKMQELMEKSALVIIDFDNAIANGFVKLNTWLEETLKDSEEDGGEE